MSISVLKVSIILRVLYVSFSDKMALHTLTMGKEKKRNKINKLKILWLTMTHRTVPKERHYPVEIFWMHIFYLQYYHISSSIHNTWKHKGTELTKNQDNWERRTGFDKYKHIYVSCIIGWHLVKWQRFEKHIRMNNKKKDPHCTEKCCRYMDCYWCVSLFAHGKPITEMGLQTTFLVCRFEWR